MVVYIIFLSFSYLFLIKIKLLDLSHLSISTNIVCALFNTKYIIQEKHFYNKYHYKCNISHNINFYQIIFNRLPIITKDWSQ